MSLLLACSRDVIGATYELARERIEAAVGGATGLLVTLLYIVVTRVGVSPGEWLQFAGVFLGVAATISGTLWLQNQRERQRKAHQRQNLLDALLLLEKLLEDIKANPKETPVASFMALDTAFRHLEWARSQMADRTYRIHVAMGVLMELWENSQESMLQGAKAIKNDPDTSADKFIKMIDDLLKFTQGVRKAASATGREESAWRGAPPVPGSI